MSSPTIKASGNIAIVWGTDNSSNLTAGLIVETLTITPKNGDPIDIEGNAGFAAIQVGLRDGFNAKATAVFDANKAYPTEGANIVLVGPQQNGAAGTNNYNCTFWSWGATRARKKEKLIELNFTHRPDING